MESSRRFSSNTVGNNAIVNQGNGNHITVNADTSNADSSFLQEISKTDPIHDKKRILMFKGPLLWDSFSWIFGHQEFSEWRHTKESGIFWIKGDPGKGKTMLLCGIIEDLEKDSQSGNLSYFFCQATDYRINTAAAVVGGLIKSLLKRHPTLLTRIREHYGGGPKGQLDGVNALVILCDIFETIVNDPALSDIVCVVDALDECIKDCSHLLNLVIKTSGRVKWLLSSRNEKDIEKGLEQVPQRLVLEFRQNAEQISLSIDAYIRHHIQQIGALKDDEQLQKTTFDTLKSKAQGTYLWVALVVEQLHKTDRWEVEHVLKEVPRDLEDLYGLILDRSEKLGRRGREACQVLLSIVTTAKRPLRLEELLVFINSHWKDSKHFKNTYDAQDIRDMAKTCGSILSIREDTIYFIHQSAKDYVVENAAQRIFPILHQHYKMFEASLDAMSSVLKYNIYDLKDPGIHIDDVTLKDLGSDPLASIRYCCVFWIEHLVLSYQFEGFEHEKYLKDDERLHSFLKEKFLCWIESLSLIRSFFPQAQIALQELKDLVEAYCDSEGEEGENSPATQSHREMEIQSLRQFTNDAYRFIRNTKEPVAQWPLQLYFSAISFEQHNSTIRKTFEQIVREKFGPSPILASKRHGESSFRLQSSFTVPEGLFVFDHTQHIPQSLLFSPDSLLIGGISINESPPVLRFLRADSGNLECTFQISRESKIAFLPKSNDSISVSQDGIVKRWSMDKKSCVGEQSLSLNYPRPDSSLPLRIVSLTQLDPLKEKVIALSPKGDLIASWHRKSSDRPGMVKIWDTKTTCCGVFLESDEVPYMHAAFSPNSQLLALSFNKGIEVYNTKTGAIVRYLNSRAGEKETRDMWNDFDTYIYLRKVERIWFSPNSRFLVAMVSTQHLCLWDTHTWKLLHNDSAPIRYCKSLECLAISPDSAILATSASSQTKLWSIDTGECIAEVPIRSLSMAFDPNWTKSSLLALRPERSVIQTWFVDISQTVPEMRHNDYVFQNVFISPDSRFVASRHIHHGEVYIWGGDDGKLVHVLKEALIANSSALFLMVFSPDSQLLANVGWRDDKNGIHIWCTITGKSVCLLECQNSGRLSSVAFSSDPKHLVASNVDGKIYIWRIDSGQLIYKYEFGDKYQKSTGTLISSISPNSAHVAAFWNLESLQAQIWHTETGKKVVIKPAVMRRGRWSRLFHEAQISFSSDSVILVSITEHVIQIFDVATGTCLQSFPTGGKENLRLRAFDPIESRIFATNAMFYKTSWKHWRMFPRRGYSYDYRLDDPTGKSGIWILLDGKKNCYVPSNFRPKSFSIYNINVAMTDCLLAILNELGEVVIVKIPTGGEARQQAVENFYAGPKFQGITSNSDLVICAPATSDSGLRNLKRRRSTSGESKFGDRDNSPSKREDKTRE